MSEAPLTMGGKLCFFRYLAPNSWNNLPGVLRQNLTLFGAWTLLILFLKSLSCVKWAQAVASHCHVLLKSSVPLSPSTGKTPLSQWGSWWLGMQGQTAHFVEQGHTYASDTMVSLHPDFCSMYQGFWSHLAWTERLRADLLLSGVFWSLDSPV